MVSRLLRDRASVARPFSTANDRFKARFRTFVWYGIMGAALLHVALFWMSPVVTRLRPWLEKVDRLLLTPPLQAAPAPPELLAAGAIPVLGVVGSRERDEIPRPPEPIVDVPEAPVSEALRALLDGPRITPYSVAPVLKNREAMATALQRLYTDEGPEADQSLNMNVWFLIDESGVVRATVVKESSGFAAWDSAVLSTAKRMQFTPAWSRGETVPVWISLPIVFHAQLPVASDSGGVEPDTVPAAVAGVTASL